MLCALTNPEFEAATDLGAIDPEIVFTRDNFLVAELSAITSSALEIYAGVKSPIIRVKRSKDLRMPQLYLV
jgi:hypothetical protein